MKYACTFRNMPGPEIIAITLPLSAVPGFDPENPPEHAYLVPDEVEVGWEKQPDGTFAPYTPPPVIPSSCSRGQGRLALLAEGKLAAVEAAIEAIADPVERKAAEINYERETWEKSNPFLQAMWTALGGTPAELDELFSLAVTL